MSRDNERRPGEESTEAAEELGSALLESTSSPRENATDALDKRRLPWWSVYQARGSR